MIPVPVLVDSCVWVQFFNRPHSVERRVVEELLRVNRVALIGPVLAEILQGFRRDEHADWVASSLEGVRYLELGWADWREVARTARQLASRGHRLPLTDLAIAAAAGRYNCSVYTTDPHFDLLPDLNRFTPI